MHSRAHRKSTNKNKLLWTLAFRVPPIRRSFSGRGVIGPRNTLSVSSDYDESLLPLLMRKCAPAAAAAAVAAVTAVCHRESQFRVTRLILIANTINCGAPTNELLRFQLTNHLGQFDKRVSVCLFSLCNYTLGVLMARFDVRSSVHRLVLPVTWGSTLTFIAY